MQVSWTVVMLALILTLDSTPVRSEVGAAGATREKQPLKVLDVEPSHAFTRLVSALHPMLQAAGQSEWSPARLQGVLGNAFSFEMRNGGGKVWQEGNLDWGMFFEIRPELEFGCEIQRFQTGQGGDQASVQKTKIAAWEAVRASINRGVPAVALCPVSAKQGAPRDWGLIVGYDASEQTYVIRRHSGEFRVRFGEIGQPAPSESFCVLVYQGPGSGALVDTHVRALKRAVAFAQGTAYDAERAAFHVDARGFAAYELWNQAFESGVSAIDQEHPRSDGLILDSHYHSGELRALRGFASGYLRELVPILPAAAEELEEAASHYDDVVQAADRLQRACGKARDAGGLSAETRREASDLIGTALESERGAIASIESALALLSKSQ